MKVALDVSAIPAQPAGAGRYVLRLVEALAASGAVELELVSRKDDLDRWQPFASEIHAVAPSARPLRLVWEQIAGPGLASAADVWHGPHYTMPLLSRAPAVVTIHDLTFFDHPEWHERGKVTFFRRMIRWSARRAAVLVCVSEPTAARLRQLLAPSCPVVVAPHGVDHDRFHPHGPTAMIDHPYVLFVGTIEPRKNVPGLVRAMAHVDPDVRLVLAGRRGWGAEDVDRTIASTGMSSRVIQLGWVDDDTVAGLLRGAAAVAYPAFTEGFGLPAVEALACGAPLVTTAGSVMADLAGDAAVLVPPGDTDALAGALRHLVGGGPDVEALRRRGPEVAAGHTWAASAERHLEAYRLASSS